MEEMEFKISKPKKEDGTARGAAHYQQAEIEVMQDYFTAEMMHGFCLGNVIKYALRARFKGSELKDIEKMAQYARWDVQVLKGERINPRE